MIGQHNIIESMSVSVKTTWRFYEYICAAYEFLHTRFGCNKKQSDQSFILRHSPSQPRWLSGLRRSHVHSLMIARRSLCPEKLGSNPGQGSKGINFFGLAWSRYVHYFDKETLTSNKPNLNIVLKLTNAVIYNVYIINGWNRELPKGSKIIHPTFSPRFTPNNWKQAICHS